MTEKQHRSVWSRIVERLLGPLLDEVEKTVRKRVDKYVQEITRTILIAMVGAVMLAGGLIFVLIGVTKGLSTIMPSWLAWGLIGIIMALIGIIAFMSARRRQS
jgi:amino acid transporter